MIQLSECPICRGPLAGAKVLYLYKGGTYGDNPAGAPYDTTFVECPTCRHVLSNPQPTWEELAPVYSSKTQFDYQHAGNAYDAEKVDRLIAKRYDGKYFNHVPVVPGGRYLDVGSGDGSNVAALGKLGMLAEGVEPRAAAAEYCRAGGLNVRTGTLEEATFPDDSFDCLSLNHVLEHVPEPIDLIRECRRVLKPGGTLFVGVPNFRALMRNVVGKTWIGLDPPRHLHQFQEDSLRSVFEKAGMRVESIESESLTEFVELELSRWARLHAKIPMRLTLKTAALRPLAAYLTRKGNATGRGESLAARAIK